VATPINTPVPAYQAGFQTVSGFATEQQFTAISGVNVNTPQQLVVLELAIDVLIGTAGVTVTLKLYRGTVAGAVAITEGATWGPFTCVATDRYSFSAMGYDIPGAMNNGLYAASITVGSASAVTTVEHSVLRALVTGSS
jgi:hypothetical protein